MQLVGATAGYIRKPFLYQSMLQGIIGAIFAVGVLLALVYFLQDVMSGVISLNDISILVILFLIVLTLGILINLFSTYNAVTKYIRIKTDKLYT
jgi:cell division transport system permease protein